MLAGDEWQLDARVLKWKGWANLLGLDAQYRLERVSGRYRQIEQERKDERTVYALSENPGIDLWTMSIDHRRWLPFVDAVYGSAVYLPMADGARYEVSITQSGLVARPVNDVAENRHRQLEVAVSPPTRGRCGRCASTGCPRPTRPDARNSAPCGRRAPDAASAGDAAVGRRDAGHAARRAVGIGRIALRWPAVVVHETQRQQLRASALRCARLRELGAPFAVRHRDRHARAGHAAKNSEGDSTTSTMREARLELLGAIAHEARPVLRARNDLASAPTSSGSRCRRRARTCRARAKNAANASRSRALNRIDFAQPSPAPSTSP